jgi:hypothetical protein
MKTCAKIVFALMPLLLTASSACAKPDRLRLVELTRQCDVQHKQDACSQLARIAIEDANELLRREAVKALTDQAMLAKVALEAGDSDIRAIAVRKLTDQALLARVAVEDKDAGAREVAVWKLTDQALLAKVAAEDASPDVRKAATDKLAQAGVLTRVVQLDKDADTSKAASIEPQVPAPPAAARAPLSSVPPRKPAADKATVLVYRASRQNTSGDLPRISPYLRFDPPVIYIGDHELEFPQTGIISQELPPGPELVVATSSETRTLLRMTPTDFSGTWTSLPGCSALSWNQLDWQRMIKQPHEQIKLCDQQLNALRARCSSYNTTVIVRTENLGCFSTGLMMQCRERQWYRNKQVVPACNPEINGSDFAVTVLNRAQFPSTVQEHELRLDIKAGKSYYIRWSVNSLDLVDDATESNEIYEKW